MVGKTISHYQILEKLGEGGMGTVYKARDSHLKRFVALKVLPSEKVADPERKHRFVQEARSASALNHPNIVTIYDIDKAEGVDFIAMEHVEGKTLDELIGRKGLKFPEALKYAVQIADALAKAHAAGIVHRDLKPGNVMVTPDGRVKVLDFGLAKLTEAAPVGPTATTQTLQPSTESGTIVGTVSYMSPEQAEGAKVDARSDIFSFGSVLYEMVTGRRAFHRDTKASTIAAILREEPKTPSQIVEGLPKELDRIVRRCLRKDLEHRFQTMADLRVALEELKQESDAGTLETEETAKPKPRRRLLWLAALVGVLLITVTGGWFVRSRTPTLDQPSKPPEMQVRKFAFTPQGDPWAPVIAPNGKHIAYIAGEAPQRRLWIQDLESIEPRAIKNSEGAQEPFWSPDSEYVSFAAGGELRRAHAQSGDSAAICHLPPQLFLGGAWSPDGESIVYAIIRQGIYKVPARGGAPKLIVEVDLGVGKGDHFENPSFLPVPDGDSVLVYESQRVGEIHEIVVHSLKTGRRKVPVQWGNQPTYSPTGHLLYLSPRGWLEAVPFSLAALDVTGEAFPVAPNGWRASVARDGTLVYVDREEYALNELTWRDRKGNKAGTVGQAQRGIRAFSISPDGRTVAASAWEQVTGDIWLHDIARGTKTRLTFTPESDHVPVWLPDGKQITLQSARQGNDDIFVMRADGSGEAKALVATPANEQPCDWSPDGRFLVYWVATPKAGVDLWYLRQKKDGGGYESVPFLQTPFNETNAAFSPEGRFLAYVSDESGGKEVYVRRFPDGGGKRQISSNGGDQPRWGADGKELFYVEGETLMAVSVTTTPDFSLGPVKRLFQNAGLAPGSVGNSYRQRYAVSRDGQRFLIAETVAEPPKPVIRVVQNWFAAFRDRR